MINNIIELVDTMAALSWCKRRKVGAVLTDDKFNIESSGFNAPLATNCCKRHDCESGSNLERCNAIHAEMVAVANKNIKGKKLFVNIFPCPICAKYLLNCRLAELYYYEDYSDMAESAQLLINSGMKIYKYKKDGSVQELKVVEKKEEKKEEKKKYFGE